MPQQFAYASALLILLNLLVSYRGFKQGRFMEQYDFEVDSILRQKQYLRLLSSGFLHVSWPHLVLNMVTLYCFGAVLESKLGIPQMLLIYLASLLGGHLLALYMHRQHGDYKAVGASGAVCGLVFAGIAVFPGLSVGLLGIHIPGWLYGLAYVLLTLYGIRAQRDHIAHEAHLGGGLTGLIVGLILQPQAIESNAVTILLIVLPPLLFFFLRFLRPHTRLLSGQAREQKGFQTFEDRYHTERVEKEQELDRILEKIARKGMESLTEREKEVLKERSK